MTEDNKSSAFQFHGNWQDYFNIAIVNLGLNIITLGFYRFWATTRERQYLWSQTQFIDERLEWTGNGKELFFGFLIVLVIFSIPVSIGSFVIVGSLIQGNPVLGILVILGISLSIFYLIGVARYRGLRYKLSRTYWHGIRGGSDVQGFAYGWSFVWKTTIGYIVFGLMMPWALMALWNERWNSLTFGPHLFRSNGNYNPTFSRYLLFYLAPILSLIIIFVLKSSIGTMSDDILSIIDDLPIAYIALGIVATIFYAKFFRVALDRLSLNKLEFGFTAQTIDWFKLIAGDSAIWAIAALPMYGIWITLSFFGVFDTIVIPTALSGVAALYANNTGVILFIGLLAYMIVGSMIRYRHWAFLIRYTEVYGEVNLDELTQSRTERARHGEGLLDAFDVGAI